MTVSRKNISEPVLFFSILSALSIFLFKDSITLFPSFIHAWTQSDRYALALGFLRNGFDFFHPQTFNLFTAHGITQVDFPIHEYLVACLMKISGTTAPVVFRLYTLLYGLTGLFFLFKLTRSNGGSFFRGLFVSVFMMTCPVFTYYLDGFLPSIPSFSNVIIGYYFFFRYKKEQRPADFALAILFLALAALARMPFFIFLFAVFCQQVLESLHLKKINRHEAIVFLIGFGIWFAYLFYNLHLASQYGSQFLLTILPAKNFHEFKEILKDIRDNWKLEYFSWLQYLALLTLIFFIFVRSWKKISSQHKPMTLQILISGTGVLIYFLCMSTQFPEHDYYVIDSLYPVIALILVHAIQNIPANSRFSKIALPATGTVLLCVFVMSSSGIMKKRYTFHEWDRTEITRQNFTGTEQFLDSIGIPKTAKMLVLDAYTTNMPLILMNRMGYALLWTTKENIDT
ncbi:MAG: glycosyltransferase family 39 protein, partial [Bacteroidetes bacterium]|nr:glycosyltransferase family 39 protein [Bacteroidota bacterium]